MELLQKIMKSTFHLHTYLSSNTQPLPILLHKSPLLQQYDALENLSQT